MMIFPGEISENSNGGEILPGYTNEIAPSPGYRLNLI